MIGAHGKTTYSRNHDKRGIFHTMIETRLWIKPDTGEERHYLQNWREAIGLEVEWYNTGNIKSAVDLQHSCFKDRHETLVR